MWRFSNVTTEDFHKNFKFKKNGIVKASHDNSKRRYDFGIKEKEEVYLSFMGFGIYTNETTLEEDYSWFSLPWMIGGYMTKMQNKLGEIARDCLVAEIKDIKVLEWLNWNPLIG